MTSNGQPVGIGFDPAPNCPDGRYLVEAGEVVPQRPLDSGERARLRAAAWRAKTVYPGPAGECVARWLREWAEYGFRFGQGSFTEVVVDDVMSRQ